MPWKAVTDRSCNAAAMTATREDRWREQFENTLEALNLGVMMIDARAEVHVCNSKALALLELPEHLTSQPFKLDDVRPELGMLEIAYDSTSSCVELQTISNKLIKIRAQKMEKGGVVLVIDDITAERKGQSDQHLLEAEYRSLFENAICGIYRDTLAGKPVRGNTAIAHLNGYETEAEYIAALSTNPVKWYVDPKRSEEFKRILSSEGRVRDFVSEVHRHRSRERIWITENAWYVRDANGTPMFIEGTIQDATERITTLGLIERQANRDTLTGVASRFRFLTCLEQETKPGKNGCTLYSIDFDRFKEINDLLGHAAGDIVLKLLAKRLESLVEESSLLARIGGDEFAILQPGITHKETIETLAKNIVAAMSQPLRIKGQDVTLGASIGISMFPQHADDAEELLSNADFAMYQAKAAGRNGFRIFDTELRSGIQIRKELEHDLRSAIAADQLELYYQPIVEGSTGQAEGFEALMRWNHPKRGFLPPDQFISIAEEAGLMTELGNWAIKRACQQMAILPTRLNVAVNVSPTQFRSASILIKLRRVLEETKLDPARLILEITESAILSDEALAEKLLRDIQAMGVGIALDDFGMGYSSLSYLQRFQFNKVKIDRSFVHGIHGVPANLAVIRAVLGIGRDLGIGVVAEGVETKWQVDTLLRAGCKIMQGYYFGKPMPYSTIVNDLAVEQLSEFRLPTATDKRLTG